MKNIKLYRKRYIPSETVLLKDDVILHIDEDVIVTKWDVLRPRKDFAKGYSCYFMKKGYKISKFLNKEGELVYYYCDIIDTSYDEQENSFVFTDLLADVIIYPDGKVKVVDVGEIADAFSRRIITAGELKNALWRLDALLNVIYDGGLEDIIHTYFNGSWE